MCVSSYFIFNRLTESDGDVVKVILVRDQAVSGSDDEPGDVAITEPETDIISPVVDERPRTAGAGPGGGAVELDEGRSGEFSYLRISPSDDRLLKGVKKFSSFCWRCQAWRGREWCEKPAEREISTSWLTLLTELSTAPQIQFAKKRLT